MKIEYSVVTAFTMINNNHGTLDIILAQANSLTQLRRLLLSYE